MIEGQFIHEELRPGLFLHVSDASEERAFTASSHLPAGLSCIFFLDGAVDMKMGERAFHFEGNAQALEGTAIMNARADSFQRSSPGGQRLRHLVVSATPEWLDIDGLQTASEGDTPIFAGSSCQSSLDRNAANPPIVAADCHATTFDARFAKAVL